MICRDCARAADRNVEIQKSIEEGNPPIAWMEHPEDCKCPCMHKPVGAWKGSKTE